jgi:hypothetical protein
MDQHTEDLVYRLRKRADIRRQIPSRKSVQNNEPDRIADLLDEAATVIERLQEDRRRLWDAHSHETVRADELQIECDRLYRIIELGAK